MGRSDDLKNTCVYIDEKERHRLSLPYFKEFCDRLVENEDDVSYSCDLYAEYLSSVIPKTSDPLSLKSANGKRRFHVNLAEYASKKRWVKVRAPKSGYKVTLNTDKKYKLSRKICNSLEYSLPDDAIKMLQVSKDLRNYPFPAHSIFITNDIGRGVVADHIIPKGSLICEYIGEVLTLKQFEERHCYYIFMNMAVTAVHLTNNSVLDGYADQDGFAMELNGGASLNHSKGFHNCVFKKVIVNGKRKYFIFAKTEIPKGFQLTWYYGDNRRGLEGWLYK